MADLRLLIEVLTKGQGDLKNLNRQLKDTGEEAEKAGSKIGNIGKAVGAFAAGFVAFKAVEFLSDATNAAAEFNDTMSATGVIIGDEALPELEKWADGAAQAFGASKQDALDAANTFAIFGKSAGLAGDDLVEFSTELTELAGDLASFRGGTTEEAIEAIGSALRGESEPIRKYGVLLDEATLKQRALKLGIIDTVRDALTPQQKTLAAQAEIFAQTTDAQGDFSRTSEDLATTQRSLGAELENVTIEIGQKLVPIMLDLANVINDNVVPAVDWFLDQLEQIGDGVEHVQDLATPDLLHEMGTASLEWAEHTEKLADGLDETSRSTRDYRANLSALADASETEWERIAAEPVSQMSAQADAIRDAAFQQQVEYAKGLLDGMNEPLVQMEALQQLQEESLDRTAEIARLKGQLASSELAAGLASNIDVVRAQAIATQLAIQSRLAQLGVDAFGWGYGIAHELALGMEVGRGEVIQGADQLGGAIRNRLGVFSEPKDPQSPLRGITEWGLNIAKTIAEGMRAGVSLVNSASSGLASSISAGTLESFSVAPGAIPDVGTATVGAGGIHIHLYNMGDPITEDDDVLESLKLLVPHIRDAALSHG